jgi:hypothetical protein
MPPSWIDDSEENQKTFKDRDPDFYSSVSLKFLFFEVSRDDCDGSFTNHKQLYKIGHIILEIRFYLTYMPQFSYCKL